MIIFKPKIIYKLAIKKNKEKKNDERKEKHERKREQTDREKKIKHRVVFLYDYTIFSIFLFLRVYFLKKKRKKIQKSA